MNKVRRKIYGFSKRGFLIVAIVYWGNLLKKAVIWDSNGCVIKKLGNEGETKPQKTFRETV